jgi:hypothetical protein
VSLDFFQEQAGYFRMGDGFQVLPGSGIAKNHRPESSPFNPAVRIQNILSETSNDLIVSGFPRFDYFMSKFIQIYYRESSLPYHPGHNAFPASDPTGDPDYLHDNNV